MAASWKNRLVGAVATGAIVAGLFPVAALGEGALTLDSTTPTPGYALTVSGLENGDTAKYYQIIEQDVDSVDGDGNVTRVGTQGWKLSASVDKNADGIVDGTEETNFGHMTAGPDGKIGTSDDVEVKGLYVDELVVSSYTTDEDGNAVTSDTRQLTPAMVNALATAVTNNKATTAGDDLTAAEGKVTVSNAKAGMYMFVAVPNATGGETNYLYKPIFVSADYYNGTSKPEDNTHLLNVVAGSTDYPTAPGATDNAGVFKRSPLTIDKQAGQKDEDGNYTDVQSDVAVGDTIDFSITFPIPAFSSNYVAPQFYVTDVLTEGLKLIPSTIAVEVKNGDDVVTTTKDQDYRIYTKSDAGTTEGFAYFKNVDTGSFDGFVVQFLNDNPDTTEVKQDGFLRTTYGAPTATITYQATVTTTEAQKFAQQVNQMDNTAKLNYSKDPNFVPDGYFTTTEKEVPKLDENGDPIQKLDEEGNPVVDEDGNPVYETETVTTTEPDPDFDTTKPDKQNTQDGSEEPTGTLTDKTRHYTFDIDADVLGADQTGKKTPKLDENGDPVLDEDGNPVYEEVPESEHDKTSEIRKIWVDANGQVIQKKTTGKTVTGEDGSSTVEGVVKGATEENGVQGEETGNYSWLEGAEFTLQKVQAHVTAEDGTGTFEDCTAEDVKFDANNIRTTTSGSNPKSDAKGYIAMKGLDAGVYILKEIKAPLGYAFNPNVQHKITIEPTYVKEQPTPTKGTTPEDGKGGADDLILESYKVTIVTQELDDNLNIVGESQVTTISTYNAKTESHTYTDEEGNEQTVTTPASFLTADGTSNVSGEGATGGIDVSVEAFGNNETAMITNKRLGLLPATGGSGILFYLTIGGAVAATALILINKEKKRVSMA